MEINEDILIRYIDGMLTEEEAVEVKNWRAASLENEKLLEQKVRENGQTTWKAGISFSWRYTRREAACETGRI